MKPNPDQLAFNLPDDAHPGVIARREQRECIRAKGEDAERAALLVRHRQEWDDHLDLWNDALLRRSYPLALLAKELASSLKIRQAEERLAWARPEEDRELNEKALLREAAAVFEQHPDIAKQFRKILNEASRSRPSRHPIGETAGHEPA